MKFFLTNYLKICFSRSFLFTYLLKNFTNQFLFVNSLFLTINFFYENLFKSFNFKIFFKKITQFKLKKKRKEKLSE